MTAKTKEDYIQEVNACLGIMERAVASITKFEHAWQSLSFQLFKLLCDKNPLIGRAVDNPTLHPMIKHKLKRDVDPDGPKFLFALMMPMRMGGGSVTYDCFDVTKNPYPWILGWIK
jgi:hypothetical protein